MAEGIPHNRVIYALLAFVGALVLVIALLLTFDGISDSRALREKENLEKELAQLKDEVNNGSKDEIPVYIDKKGDWTVAENTSKEAGQKTELYNLVKDSANSLRCVDLRSADNLLGLLNPAEASRNDQVLTQALSKYLPEESHSSFFALIKTSFISSSEPIALIDKLCKTSESFLLTAYEIDSPEILIIQQLEQSIGSQVSYSGSFYTPLKTSDLTFAEVNDRTVILDEYQNDWRIYAVDEKIQAFDLIEACETSATSTECSREVIFETDDQEAETNS